MNNSIAVYSGTFDPLTRGHEDLVRRASRLFQKVIIAVAESRKKQPMFDLAERVDIARRILSDFPNVEVQGFDSLLMDFAREKGASIILRGLRAVSDFEYEFQMVGMNRALDSSIETVFLMADARRQAIASKLVKEIARLGGDVSKFVTPAVNQALRERFPR